MSDAPDRAAFGSAQERLFRPGKQLNQCGASEAFSRVEIGKWAAGGKLVPGTHQLAVIAAINPVADQRAQVLRDGPRVFDGEVGNTASGIQAARTQNGLGRAGGDAGRASAAMLGYRFADRQGNVHVDFAQEKHRTAFAVQHQRVFASPALPTALRQLGLQHGRGVGERAVTQRPHLPGDAFGELLQARPQHLVVVTPTGIDGHNGFPGLVQPGQLDPGPAFGCRTGQIIHPGRDHAHRTGHQLGRPGTPEAVARHEAHVAMKPLGQPGLQARLGRRQVHPRHANVRKPQLPSPGLNQGNEFGTVWQGA